MPYHPRGRKGGHSKKGRELVFGGFCIFFFVRIRIKKWINKSESNQIKSNQLNDRDWRFYIIKVSGKGVRINDDLQVSDGYGGQSYCLHAPVRINEGV